MVVAKLTERISTVYFPNSKVTVSFHVSTVSSEEANKEQCLDRLYKDLNKRPLN